MKHGTTLLLLFTLLVSQLQASQVESSTLCNCTSSNKPDANLVVKLVVSLARLKEYDDARTELTKMNNYTTLLAPIIEQLYNGSNTRTQQILQLFEGISCAAYAEGLDKLINKTVEYEKLTDAQILIIARYLEDLGCLNNNKIVQLSTLLKTHVDTFLDKWAQKILLEDFYDIYNFTKFGGYELDSFNRQVGKLFEKVYSAGSKNAFNATLKFVNGEKYLNTMTLTYTSIVNELRKKGQTHSNEMITIMYYIHQRMQIDWNQMSAESQELYTNSKNSIPAEIHNLFWHTSCTIKNLHFNEYLFATNGLRDNTDGNGDVFTWTPGNQLSSSDWILSPGINDGSIYFSIKNKYLVESDYYLCESKNNASVVTCRDDSQGYRQWFVRYATGVANSGFLIKNSNFNSTFQDYLQATSNHNVRLKRRIVENKGIGNYGYWKIECS